MADQTWNNDNLHIDITLIACFAARQRPKDESCLVAFMLRKAQHVLIGRLKTRRNIQGRFHIYPTPAPIDGAAETLAA